MGDHQNHVSILEWSNLANFGTKTTIMSILGTPPYA